MWAAAGVVSTFSETSGGGGVDLPTLLVTAVASAAAAYVTSQVWAPGTLASAAFTPVVVALLKELLRASRPRSSSRAPCRCAASCAARRPAMSRPRGRCRLHARRRARRRSTARSSAARRARRRRSWQAGDPDRAARLPRRRRDHHGSRARRGQLGVRRRARHDVLRRARQVGRSRAGDDYDDADRDRDDASGGHGHGRSAGRHGDRAAGRDDDRAAGRDDDGARRPRRARRVHRRRPVSGAAAAVPADARLEAASTRGRHGFDVVDFVTVVASRGVRRPRKTPDKTIRADSHEYALAV